MDQADLELNKSLHQTIFNPSERIAPMQTFRDVLRYSSDLGYMKEEDFIKDITGKKVLDAGSGHGGLFKSAAQRNIQTTIINLNPVMADKDRRWELNWMPNLHDPSVQNIIQKHNASLVPAIAPFLPFKDASFDMILDLEGPLSYSANDQKSLYLKILDEYLRVIKSGGKVRFSIPHNGPEYFDELEELMKQHKIEKYKRLELMQLEKPTNLHIYCGFEVTK